MKYQGINKVSLEINSEYGVEVGFELVKNNMKPIFEVKFYTFFDKDGETTLIGKSYETQKALLQGTNDVADKYIANFFNEMLVDTAEDNYMLALQSRGW